ncbi:MAG: prolyl oligopeptidase family serine peptidase [Holosporales bacterium]|nr:prolyl oligopeptidase family serine peptidase [Holosporales bacterium]
MKIDRYKSKKFEKAKRIVIILHGYGASGTDFLPLYNYMKTAIDDAVFLLPDAPHPCDQTAGFGGRQWFHLDEDMSYKNIRDGLDTSGKELFENIVIMRESFEEYGDSIPFENIAIMGFSQGAMLAFEMIYYANFSHIIPYSGLFAVKPRPHDRTEYTNNKILIVHGDDDVNVPYSNMKHASKNLSEMGVYNEMYTCHNIGHSISEDGLKHGVQFILK